MTDLPLIIQQLGVILKMIAFILLTFIYIAFSTLTGAIITFFTFQP